LSVDESDEATYACTIRNAVEMKTASASLTVLCKIKHHFFVLYFFKIHSTAAPRFNPLPDTYRVGLKNLTIELHCRVRGNPKPKITWHKSRNYPKIFIEFCNIL
jgi:hypothetical protein